MNFALTPHKHAINELMELYNTDNNIIVRVFIDLRNAYATFFDEEQLAMIIRDPVRAISEFIRSTLDFMNYMRKMPYEIEFHYFYEVGRSEYHKKIDKNYKSSRGGSYQILKERQIKQAKDLNIKAYDVFESISRNLPEVRCYKINYFEADFIPHYIIKKLGTDINRYNGKNIKNIIMSNDKDLMQTLDPNKTTIQLRKNFRQRKTVVVTFDNMYQQLLKNDTITVINDNENFIADILSIAGDKEDDVTGITKIGYKHAYDILNFFGKRLKDLIKDDVDVDSLDVKRIKNKIKTMFENIPQLEDNLKLVDFDVIMENIPLRTEQYIKKEYYDDKDADIKILVNDLQQLGIDYNSYVEAFADAITNTFPKGSTNQTPVNPYNIKPPKTTWKY